MSTDDSVVEDIVLAVVNDGNGSLCGADYKHRCEVATYRTAQSAFRHMAREYGRRAHDVFGTKRPTLKQTRAAGDRLLEYYKEHLKEL